MDNESAWRIIERMIAGIADKDSKLANMMEDAIVELRNKEREK